MKRHPLPAPAPAPADVVISPIRINGHPRWRVLATADGRTLAAVVLETELAARTYAARRDWSR